jgi:hypothetical protein
MCLVVFVYGSANSWYGIARKNQLKIWFFNVTVRLSKCSGNIAATLYFFTLRAKLTEWRIRIHNIIENHFLVLKTEILWCGSGIEKIRIRDQASCSRIRIKVLNLLRFHKDGIRFRIRIRIKVISRIRIRLASQLCGFATMLSSCTGTLIKCVWTFSLFLQVWWNQRLPSLLRPPAVSGLIRKGHQTTGSRCASSTTLSSVRQRRRQKPVEGWKFSLHSIS